MKNADTRAVKIPANVQGIIWALTAAFLYALTAVMAKVAVQEYHVLQILFFRQLVVFVSALPAISKGFPESLGTAHPLLHVSRLAGAFVALAGSIWAVSVLPLTTAITLGFSQAFFVTLLAVLILGESVGKHRIGAVVIGFIGVLIAMRPSTGLLFDGHTLIPVGAALGAAIAVISVRKLSQTESTATLLVYQSVFIGVLSGIPLLWLWTTPDLAGLRLLLAMGVVAAIGQWIGVQALRLGEASVIGTIKYTELVYAAILGYVIFSEIPDPRTMTGAGIIILASVYLFRREALVKDRR